MTSMRTRAKGIAMMIVALCSAGMPPTISMPMVRIPVAAAHRMRSDGRASVSAAGSSLQRFAMTSAPESAEVT